MPSVIQILKKVMPSGAKIVAGETGLYNEVSWVIIVRPTPPGFDSLKGNELAIIGDNVASGLEVSPAQLVTALADCGASGIVLTGEISQEVKNRAQTAKIPLIQLPPQTGISALETAITRLISEERQELYQRERELNHSLLELALAGGGSADIVEKLRQLTGRCLGFIDLNYNPQFPLDALLAEALKKNLSQAALKLRNDSADTATAIIGLELGQQQACFLGLIKAGKENRGYLMLMASEDEITEADRLAVRVGSMALAVEMSRRQAVEETQARYETDIFVDLLNGNLTAEDMDEAGRRLNMNPSLPFVCLELHIAALKAEQATVLKNIESLFPECRGYAHNGDFVILFPLEKTRTVFELRKLGKEIHGKLTTRLEGMLTLGIGRACSGLGNVPYSFREAEQSLAMGLRLFGPGSVTCFTDLGIYRLLFALKSSGELIAFQKEYLGALSDYDRKHDGELVQTLKVFLQNNAVAGAARELHVHRNTLLYRLERIQEITGSNLEDGETRLALYVAILASEVIAAG
jgi:PucR family transcriptional regulator, purine catabolism regulatory protein